MELTAKDVARILGVTDDTVHDWVDHDGLPCYRVKDKIRFNRVEILEWATSRGMRVSPQVFRDEDSPAPPMILTESLRRGGVMADVGGGDRDAVLRAVCEALPLPPRVRRKDLLAVLLAREKSGSTGIGGGLALPHPRKPLLLGLDRPLVGCAYLRQPVDFGAVDRRPVHTMFVIVATTAHVHLLLLSHLMCALQDPAFRALVDRRAGVDSLCAELGRVESGLGPFGAPGGMTG